MSRLIDADRALEIVRDQGIAHPNAYHLTNYATFILREAPTVDAVEVVHAEWISWKEADNLIPSPDRHECSICHDAAQVLVNGLELLSPYCPNCGAKMDGGINK